LALLFLIFKILEGFPKNSEEAACLLLDTNFPEKIWGEFGIWGKFGDCPVAHKFSGFVARFLTFLLLCFFPLCHPVE
jgi:hypothetical protein